VCIQPPYVSEFELTDGIGCLTRFVLAFFSPGGLNAFPRGRKLDEHTIFADSLFSVQCNQLLGLADATFRIERQSEKKKL
jgi:hypothetical protein